VGKERPGRLTSHKRLCERSLGKKVERRSELSLQRFRVAPAFVELPFPILSWGWRPRFRGGLVARTWKTDFPHHDADEYFSLEEGDDKFLVFPL